MTQVTPSSVTRTIDQTGTEIKAFLDDENTFIQAMALVDDKGNQIAVSGNPLYVTITGDFKWSSSSVKINKNYF